MSSRLRVLTICAALMPALCACDPVASSKASVPADGAVAATVNGIAISENRIARLARQRTAQGQADDPEARRKIIDHLATQFLIAQEAVRKGLDNRPEVADQIDLARQSILANAFVQDYLKNVSVSDEAAQLEYERVKGQMTGREYKARQILVEKEAEAKDIIAKLRTNPQGFQSLARERSMEPGAKANGGDLGWFDLRGVMAEIGIAVANLEPGKFTAEPVRSQLGYHVVLLESTRAKPTPPFDQVKSALQQKIQQQKLRELVDDLKAKAKIEIVQAGVQPASR